MDIADVSDIIYGTMIGTLISVGFTVFSVFQALPKVCTSTTPFQNHSILFVTAHPDDEVMFFGPLLRHVLTPEKNNSVNILCMSTGDANGLGDVRVKELQLAAQYIGLPPQNITVVDKPETLSDSIDAEWSHEEVADFVNRFALEVDAAIYISFDEQGVSGHPNHIATGRGTALAAEKRGKVGDEILFVELQTVAVWRKYLFIVDAVWSRFIDWTNGRGTTFNKQSDYHALSQAMTQGHRSQMEWYRYLYLSLSRYMLVNSFDYNLFPKFLETPAEPEPAQAEAKQDSGIKLEL